MANCYADDNNASDTKSYEVIEKEIVSSPCLNMPSEVKNDSQTDHSVDQHIVAENTETNNESQVTNNNHVKSPAVGQAKVNVRGTSPTVIGKDETRGTIDPQKVKEREERLRMARERREEAQKRRMEELQEALARHQEARKKQEDERRRKIEEMKRREEEHRIIVEERRKKLIDDENERRQSILRRNAEREARLELLKPVKHSLAATSFGGSIAPSLSGPRSMNVVAHPNASAFGTPLRRSAVSVRDVAGSSTDPRSNSRSIEPESSSVAIKRLSVSTSHLSHKRQVSSVDRRKTKIMGSADEDSLSRGFNVLQPFGCPKGNGNQSDGTVSANSTAVDRSRHQQRRSRPRSLVVNWRSPGYASDTVSSMQLKSSHSGCANTSLVAGGVVCSRFRSVSPSTKGRACSTGPVARNSRADTVKNADHRVKDDTNKDSLSASSKTQKLARVKSMPSKLNADSKNSPAVSSVATPKPVQSGDVTISRARTQSLKRINQPQTSVDSTPTTTRSMPNPPKAMTPRSVPKEPRGLKDVTSTSSVATPGKGSVKAVHNLPDQKSARDKKKDDPVLNKGNVLSEKSDSVNNDIESSQKNLSGASEDTVVDVKDKSSEVQASSEIQPTNGDVINEKSDVVKKASNVEDDYKSKLAENRRLAREKAEREAAEEKQREEDRLRMEEEERLREEEEQRLREEEELRMAEEARRQEEERFQRAVEEAERQRKEEDERQEAERREKHEMELRIQEESEKKEKERLERLKREEEERLERKKKLDMIMKRVKTDESSLQKDVQSSPVGSVAEGLNTVSSSESLSLSDSTRTQVLPAVVAPVPAVDNGVSKFRSPLLRQMMEGKLSKASNSRTELVETPSANSLLSDACQQNVVDAETGSTKLAVNYSMFDADDSITMTFDSKVVDDDKDIDESEFTGLSSINGDQIRYNGKNQSVFNDFSYLSSSSSTCISPDALIPQDASGNGIVDSNFGDQAGFDQVIDLSLVSPTEFGDSQLTNGHDSRPPPAQPLIAFD